MTLQFFYDPQGGALCQNQNGLTFFLQGQPPTRPAKAPGKADDRPSYPGQANQLPRGPLDGWRPPSVR